jgi:hypothetical protein
MTEVTLRLTTRVVRASRNVIIAIQ